jgi:PKD repeat protein
VAVAVVRGETPVATLDESDFESDEGEYAAAVAVSEPGAYTATLETATTAEGVEGASGQTDTASAVAVSLEPATAAVPVSGTTAYEVVVSPAPDGVGGYEFSAASGNRTVAAVTGASAADGAGDPDEETDGDGASVAVEDVTFGGPGPVTVGTVEATGVSGGETGLTLSELSVSGVNGEAYLPLAGDAAVNVTPAAPVVVDGVRANDPDGDGSYDDVNGDGRVDVVDVQALYANHEEPSVRYARDYFNFSAGGGIDAADARALFEEVVA